MPVNSTARNESKRQVQHSTRRNVSSLKHLITQDGLQADPEKTKAITKLKPPENVTKLRRFGKFSQNLAQLAQSLRELPINVYRVEEYGLSLVYES